MEAIYWAYLIIDLRVDYKKNIVLLKNTEIHMKFSTIEEREIWSSNTINENEIDKKINYLIGVTCYRGLELVTVTSVCNPNKVKQTQYFFRIPRDELPKPEL